MEKKKSKPKKRYNTKLHNVTLIYSSSYRSLELLRVGVNYVVKSIEMNKQDIKDAARFNFSSSSKYGDVRLPGVCPLLPIKVRQAIYDVYNRLYSERELSNKDIHRMLNMPEGYMFISHPIEMKYRYEYLKRFGDMNDINEYIMSEEDLLRPLTDKERNNFQSK